MIKINDYLICKNCNSKIDIDTLKERYFDYSHYCSYDREYKNANYLEDINHKCENCQTIIVFNFNYELMSGTWEEDVFIEIEDEK